MLNYGINIIIKYRYINQMLAVLQPRELQWATEWGKENDRVKLQTGKELQLLKGHRIAYKSIDHKPQIDELLMIIVGVPKSTSKRNYIFYFFYSEPQKIETRTIAMD